MATYTVVKGDCLWGIARRFLGDGTRWTQLADKNGISKTNPIIYPGQVINLDVNGTSAPKTSPTSSTPTKPTVQYFGLQAGTDRTLFATWKWSRANTNGYSVWWEYATGDGVWFVGNITSTAENVRQSTYSAPSNATKVRFWVKAISETHTVNNAQVSYWTGKWSTAITYDFTNAPPVAPSNLSVSIDDNYKLTVTAQYTSTKPAADGIQFQIVKDNTTIFNTGNAELKTTLASYSCTVSAGGEYKVRCRAYRGKLYSSWTDYSSNTATAPSAPIGITSIKATSKTSIYLEWDSVTTATSYDIEYATQESYFDGSDKTSTVSGIEFNHYEKTGLETGNEYFFRVRASNSKGKSAWTSPKSIVIGKTPVAPTTWSSTTTAITGEPLTLYWVHNAEDGSSETYAELELIIGSNKQTKTIKKSTDEDKNDLTSTYSVSTSGYTEGTKIQWRVRTAGITKEYGEWSIQRTIDVYTPPTMSLNITNSKGEALDEITSFPFYLKGLTGPKTQAPIGYYLTITTKSAYETVDEAGCSKMISKGEQIYSKYFDTTDQLTIAFSAGNIDLENNVTYTISCIASMNSGLTATSSVDILVAWKDETYQPSAEIGINKDTLTAYIRPYCEYYPYEYYEVTKNGSTYTPTTTKISTIDGTSVNGAVTTTGETVYSGRLNGSTVYFCARVAKTGKPVSGITLSVYRREFDGSFTELATGIANGKNTYITDPHPALDYARYRIVATSTSTGAVSYTDMPGYPVNEKAVIIQWDEEWQEFDVTDGKETSEKPWSGSLLRLPYNIDVSDNHSADVSLIKYQGRKRPVSYYGTQLGETASWKVEIEKSDVDTLYALRRLAIWMGDVYVREPSGSGYWANISVSFSQTHKVLTIPVTLDITRVEGGI